MDAGRVDEERQVLDASEFNTEGGRPRVERLVVDKFSRSVNLVVSETSGDGGGGREPTEGTPAGRARSDVIENQLDRL